MDTDSSRLGDPGAAAGADAGSRDGSSSPPSDGAPDGANRTDGGDSTCPGGCDDGVACTDDTCASGTCVRTPRDELCPGDDRCNPVLGCVPRRCRTDVDCTDGLFCTGTEVCDATSPAADTLTGCVAGAPVVCEGGDTCEEAFCDEQGDRCTTRPRDALCDDGVDCTRDRCQPGPRAGSDGCLHEEDDALCDTGFCFVGAQCQAGIGCVGGTVMDCRDGDPCTVDTCSDAERMCVSVPRDDDGDGFTTAFIGLTLCGGLDCDDGNAAIYPGAEEVCNGVDDNCDGFLDEGCEVQPDGCESAEPIVLRGNGRGSTSGTFGAFVDDYQSLCGDAGGRDAVYYIDVTELSDVTIDTIGSVADTVLSISTTCGHFVGCDDDIDPGLIQDSRMWAHRVAPRPGGGATRLYILVDGYSGATFGDFVVNVEVDPATPDSCEGPLDISSGGTVLGFIGVTDGVSPTRGTCQLIGDTSGEGVLRVRPESNRVTLQALSEDFAPDLYLRESPCADLGSELACVNGGDVGGGLFLAQISNAIVAAGSDYYVFVDGASPSSTYVLAYNP